jgi:dTDP-glucose 4,6-dehydratase
MKILVTGGLGFIGTNFIKQIVSRNPVIKLINVDKMGTGSNPKNLIEFDNKEFYSFIKGDISQIQILKKVMQDIDAVINFAAETHVDRSIANPNPFLKSNVIGAYNILETIRSLETPIRYIQISTDEIYGDILEGTFREDDRLKPSNPYSATKAAADMLCQAYHRTYGMDILITRCTNNFGPYQYPEKLIPKTIIRALKNLKIPVYGTGENIRDWLYVKDHCDAIELVLKKGKSGEIYNVSSGNELSTISIVTSILDYLKKTRDLITYVEDRPGHDLRYGLDSSKIRKKLKWQPKYSFPSSIQKTIDWYLNNDWWWSPLINEKVLDKTPWKAKKSE